MKLVIYGSRKVFGLTRALDKLLATAEFKAWASENGAVIIDCDKTEQPANYKAYISKVGYKGGSWPQIFVCDNALKVQGSFVARKYTVKTLTAKIASLCGACSDVPSATKTCPTCKGAGVVAVLVACALTLSTGCCVTRISTPEASGWRCAFLYPFEAGAVSMKTASGSVDLNSYKTTGGAAELVPLVDASGKLVGTFVGTAAKAAVLP